MAKTIKDIDTLKEYLNGVLGRADHHAQNVNEIVLAIAGAIIWQKDKIKIEVLTRKGKMGNVLWLTFGDSQKICFRYNHRNGNIEVKQRTFKGKVIKSFNNRSSLKDIKDFFKK